jgi:hypothetical protein
MKKGILITEDEKKTILNLYGLIKEEIIQNWAQIDIKGPVSTNYTSNIDNYPSCIKQMGKPIRVAGVPFSSYTVKGTGDVVNFLFFPYRYTFYNDDPSNLYVKKIEDDTPMAYDKTTKQYLYYSCLSNNKVKIGDTTYNLTPTRKIPKTEEDLTKSGYYLTIGDRGELVKKIQKLLANNAEGYATMFSQQTKPGKTPFDGIFGKTTQGVVKEYQKDNQITQTGKVDNSTWEKLKNTRIRRDWDINTGGWVFVDTSEPLSTVARRDIAQIPTEDKTIAPLTN